MSDIITARDVDIITAEINTIKTQTQRMLVANAIEIGRRLVEAKSMVPHGEWGKYLEERVNYSQSTANNLMKLFQEYGDNQESLFDSFTNSQTFGNLTYTKALALLSVPAEDRQEFAETHDVEKLSTRELEELIKTTQQEKDQATAREAEVQNKLDEVVAAQELSEKEHQAKIDDLQRQLDRANEVKDENSKKVTELEEKLKAAKATTAAVKKEVAQLKANPAVPDEVMEQMRKEAAADAAKAAQEDVEKQLAAINKQLEEANAKTREVEQKLEAAQKAAKLSNPEAVAFKVKFDKFQAEYNGLHKDLQGIVETNPELGKGLSAALRALLGNWLKALGE